MNLQGEFHNTLDTKGRVSIPAEFRQQLPDGEAEILVMTKNREGGLSLLLPSVWKELNVFVERQKPQVRTALNLLYISPAQKVSFDSQGRVSMQQALRRHAGLDDGERGVVVVGNFDRIDLFSERRHSEVLEAAISLVNGDEALLDEYNLP